MLSVSLSFFLVLSLLLEFIAGAVGFKSRDGNLASLFQRVAHRPDVKLHPLPTSLFLFNGLFQIALSLGIVCDTFHHST